MRNDKQRIYSIVFIILIEFRMFCKQAVMISIGLYSTSHRVGYEWFTLA